MLNQLFTYPGVLARHRCAPFLNERERFLTHRADEGLAPATLIYLAGKLLIIAKTLALEVNHSQPLILHMPLNEMLSAINSTVAMPEHPSTYSLASLPTGCVFSE